MRIGGTPTHTFTLPTALDTSTFSYVQITYKQAGRIIKQFKTPNVTVNAHSLQVTLTQADTFLFAAQLSKKVEIQIRVLLTSGSAIVSNVMQTTADKCLDDTVLAAAGGA